MVKKILAHPVTSPIHIGEFVFPKDWIFCQNQTSLTSSPKDVHSFLNEVEVIAKDFIIRDDWVIRFRHIV